MRKLLVAAALATPLFPCVAERALAQTSDSVSTVVKAAVLSGIVKDEYGDPLMDAEVRVSPGNASMRTDNTGSFHFVAPPGQYTVVFRRLGYAAEDYSWRARSGESTQLSIRLDPLAHSLDTITVRDTHDRVAGNSSISGVVMDSLLHPLSDVEIQMMGTGRHATSYETGQFFFAGLAEGDYVLRARKMGYGPANFTVRVKKGEAHEFRVLLDPLPHTLSTIQVREQSGYGRSEAAWEEFDRRQRWKSGLTAMITRDDLDRQGKTPLDWALRGTRAQSIVNIPIWTGGRSAPMSIIQRKMHAAEGPQGDVCILLNGVKGERLPLSWFTADEIERVEVIAKDNDWTGTVGDRMGLVKGCERDGIHNPPYFVVWVKGGS